MKLIILAAGKGSRLQSETHTLPKVLRSAHNKPLIDYVLAELNFINKENTTIVVGYKQEVVREHLGHEYRYAEQLNQLGTGHAVKMAESHLQTYDGPVLVVYGDMPLFKASTYKKLLGKHKQNNNACTLLTSIEDINMSYGRIIRNSDGKLTNIIEEKDCNKEQLLIKELNVGVYVFDSKLLFEYLSKLKTDNVQGEYYLTDVPKLMTKHQRQVDTLVIQSSDEIYGVNTLEDLNRVEQILEKRGDL